MKISKEAEKKIEQLQILEQSLQSILFQKQTFQAQLLEIENALEELEKSKDPVYKVVGPIMVISKKSELKKELLNSKEIIDLRIGNLGKQEEKIKERASELQKEIVKLVDKGV